MATGRISVTVTQGSADAFANGQLNTALTGQTDQAYKINQVLWEWAVGMPAVNGSSRGFSISRRTKAAEPALSDNDIIYKESMQARLVTSGAFVSNKSGIYNPEGDILIVEDPLFVQVFSSGTSTANSLVLVIEYEIVRIKEIDRLTLLTQSLD